MTFKELNTVHEGWNIKQLLSCTNVRPSEGSERVRQCRPAQHRSHSVGTNYPYSIRGRVDQGSIEDIDRPSTANGFTTHDPSDSIVDTASFNVIEICSVIVFFLGVMRVGCHRNSYHLRQWKTCSEKRSSDSVRVLLKAAVNYRLGNTLAFIRFVNLPKYCHVWFSNSRRNNCWARKPHNHRGRNAFHQLHYSK